MILIVSLQDVKEHLHIVANNQDSDLQLKALAASALVCNYMNKIDWEASPVVFPWTGEIPFEVIAATLMVVGDLNQFREASGVMGSNLGNFNPLSPAVKSLLFPYHNPVMA